MMKSIALFCCFLITIGCTRTWSLSRFENAYNLQKKQKGSVLFYYKGSDQSYHYFNIQGGSLGFGYDARVDRKLIDIEPFYNKKEVVNKYKSEINFEVDTNCPVIWRVKNSIPMFELRINELKEYSLIEKFKVVRKNQ